LEDFRKLNHQIFAIFDKFQINQPQAEFEKPMNEKIIKKFRLNKFQFLIFPGMETMLWRQVPAGWPDAFFKTLYRQGDPMLFSKLHLIV